MVILKNDLLVAFERVVELKTVHAAAHSLSLTQAAVTKRIKLLELELGTSLFLRSRRGMAPTDEGRALLQFCKTINAAEGEFLSRISGDAREDVPLTIVGPTSFISTRLAIACEPILKKYSFLRLNMRSDDHANLIEVLKRGEADFAIVPSSQVPNEMTSKVLKPDRYLLVASHTWRNRALGDILKNERIIDFYESDSTTLNYLRLFDLESSVARNRLFINENEALIQYFIAGIGFGTMT